MARPQASPLFLENHRLYDGRSKDLPHLRLASVARGSPFACESEALSRSINGSTCPNNDLSPSSHFEIISSLDVN